MLLKVVVDEQLYELNVPDQLIRDAGEFFDQMDRDLDGGVQMSREWVDRPNREQRCQVVGNKLLTALENGNDRLGRLTAGYLLSRMPDLDTVELDTSGEIQNTAFVLRETLAQPASAATPTLAAPTAGAMDKMAALEQAGQDVTKVFKVGHQWRFSVFDHGTGQWHDAPMADSKEEAERLRQEAFRHRYEALLAGG
jgi:hypothetical protein